ncbi:MAG: hypothetical protein QOF66_6882 [Mycobacterium sp.]|nr:hypothetical protein [Mycobacterium sp.]
MPIRHSDVLLAMPGEGEGRSIADYRAGHPGAHSRFHLTAESIIK